MKSISFVLGNNKDSLLNKVYSELEELESLRNERLFLVTEQSISQNKLNDFKNQLTKNEEELNEEDKILLSKINEKINTSIDYFVTKVSSLNKQINILEENFNQSKNNKSLQDLFKDKKQSVANIIQNVDTGEILLLKRAANDTFHPSTWCLPGGGIDFGELPIQACKRETKEEIGYDCHNPILLEVVSLPNIHIHYYLTQCTSEELKGCNLILSHEHDEYTWCSLDAYKDMDLILDLKSHLNDFFSKIQEVTKEQAPSQQIDLEVENKEIQDPTALDLQKDITQLSNLFNKGVIDEMIFTKAVMKLNEKNEIR